MEEEKITIEESQVESNNIEENNKKNNKGIKVFIYIIIFILAIVGIVLSVTGVEFNFDKEDKYSEVEQDNDKYEDPEIDENEQNEQESIPNEDEEDQNEDEEEITNMDSYVKQIDFKVTKDDREKLINSTNCSACLNGDIYGEMYKEEISDNFKLLYTARELWMKVQEEISETDYINEFYGDVSISEKLLLENARKIFADVKIPATFDKNMFYMGTSAIRCEDGMCIFNQSTFGVTGISPFSGYENKLTVEGNNIKVEQLYITDEYIDYNETNDTYIFDLKIYDKKEGIIIKEFKSYEIDLSKDLDIYEEFSQYYEKIPTYIFKFDENNKLLEVTKVDE